ncbi:MAG: sulfite exporter TauE/SafE family protein [Actinomycetales bacterium]
MEIILAIVCGIAIGSILGFVGAGGSMVAVPILIYIFGFTPIQATTASLVIVFAGALSGVIAKFKENEVLIRDALVIWSLGLITNFGGAYLLPKISEKLVLTGFALVLTAAGISMLVPQPTTRSERRMSTSALIFLSLLIGAITGLFGIGGGFIAIPILILFYNVPPAKAAGTSLFIIAINTVTGFVAHYRHWSEVEWTYPILIALFAIITSRIAVRISTGLRQSTLKRVFALTVFAIACFTLFETWR